MLTLIARRLIDNSWVENMNVTQYFPPDPELRIEPLSKVLIKTILVVKLVDFFLNDC